MLRLLMIGVLLVIAYYFLSDWLAQTALELRHLFCWMFPRC